MSARRPLSRRLLFAMLPWYLLPAIGLTAAQIAIQYHTERVALGADLAALAHTIEPGMAEELWQLDQTQLAVMAHALLESSRISGVEIDSDRGEALVRAGKLPAPTQGRAPRDGGGTAFSLPLYHQPDAAPHRLIGRLLLYADDSVLWNHIKYSSLSVIVQSLLMAAGLWLIVSLGVRWRLVAELQTLARVVTRRRLEHRDPIADPLRYAHDDELGDLVLALNQSEASLQTTMLELDALNRNLEVKVQERTQELQTAKELAESADRTKSAFLATMSHELRTPLNSIIGFTGILLQGLAGPLNPEQSKQLGMVRGSARHLLALINDVLDISKIESDRLSVAREPFNLAASLQQAVASVRPLAERKGLQLQVQVATDVGMATGDRRRFEQVLINLLGNAVKFTEHGSISLDAGLVAATPAVPAGQLQAHQGDPAQVAMPAVSIVIEDSGIGIRPEDMSMLFQPFRQIDATLARTHDGTGLGLAICGRLMVLMGGAVSASSRWQSGTRFQVLLPLQPPLSGTRA